MKPQLAARALAIKRAATMVGGIEQLAERLKVPERQLHYWIRDIGSPPDTVFLDVIDIIIESAGSRPPESVPYRAAA
jgi:hypothetical protein